MRNIFLTLFVLGFSFSGIAQDCQKKESRFKSYENSVHRYLISEANRDAAILEKEGWYAINMLESEDFMRDEKGEIQRRRDGSTKPIYRMTVLYNRCVKEDTDTSKKQGEK